MEKNVQLKAINWGIVYSSRKTLTGKETEVVGVNEFWKSSVVPIFHVLPNLPFLRIIES